MTGLMDYGERKKLFRGGLRHGFGDRQDLIADRGAHLLRQQVLFGKLFPRGDGTVRCFGDDRPEGAYRQARSIREAAHLVGSDFSEAAAAAESQGQFVARNVRKRGDKIVSGR